MAILNTKASAAGYLFILWDLKLAPLPGKYIVSTGNVFMPVRLSQTDCVFWCDRGVVRVTLRQLLTMVECSQFVSWHRYVRRKLTRPRKDCLGGASTEMQQRDNVGHGVQSKLRPYIVSIFRTVAKQLGCSQYRAKPWARWTCGKRCAHIPLWRVPQFLQAQEGMELYCLMPRNLKGCMDASDRDNDRTEADGEKAFLFDVCGGALPRPWKDADWAWPRQEDACLFEATQTFAPTTGRLEQDGALAVPPCFGNLVGQTFTSANTLGDGACGIHAAFGSTNRHRQLECARARSVALEALAQALRNEGAHLEPHAAAVRASLWDELALPAARGVASPEASLFWQHLLELHPEEAAKVQAAVRLEASRDAACAKQKGMLSNACREFFLNASATDINTLCSRIGYSTHEGAEDCFEQRRGGKYVKGTLNSIWPPAGPVTKMEAICCEHAAFDGLREAVFLSRDLGHCIGIVKELAMNMASDNVIILAKQLEEYHQHLQSQSKTQSTQPPSFYNAAVDAYLSAVVEKSYFFSYDEVATVAEIKGQSLLIVKEAGGTNFVPCCVVANAAPQRTQPVVILVKNANTNDRVRSHFERLAPENFVRAGCGAAAHAEGDKVRAPEEGEPVLCLTKHWLKCILSGKKTLELRAQSTRHDFIWLAERNVIAGSARVSRTQKLNNKTFLELRKFHQVDGDKMPYETTFGLWLVDVVALPKPKEFLRLRGAIGWCRVRFSRAGLWASLRKQQQRSGADSVQCVMDGCAEQHRHMNGAGCGESLEDAKPNDAEPWRCAAATEDGLSGDEPRGTEIPTGRPDLDDAETRTGAAAKEGCSSEDEAGSKDIPIEELLSQDCNGHLEFESAVQALIDIYTTKKSTSRETATLESFAFLASLPLVSCEITNASWSALQVRLRNAYSQYVSCGILSVDAVNTACALWRTAFFPVTVVLAAWSKTTGLPMVFYLDSFYALAASLVHKHITFDVAGLPCRARYWSCGTAAPGSGKSPSLDALKARAK